ncbi:MAG TPA: DUF3592 domain-containing protein [Candidatus Acidoferrales bacterium]|nr:DUF3592 domain-containing protein [Candidatus Acidoferrales bacterium]
MTHLFSNWTQLLPVAGLIAMAAIGIVVWLRRKPIDASEIERQRRAYLNKVGRIVEGQILEISENALPAGDGKHHSPSAKNNSGSSSGVKLTATASSNGTQRLIYYTYSISGVTYETAQDVTGLEERLHLKRAAVGQTASVKYDPSNPSNSILLADDWSGLH